MENLKKEINKEIEILKEIIILDRLLNQYLKDI